MNPTDSAARVITHKWILVRGLVIAVAYGVVAFGLYLGLKYSYAKREIIAIFESYMFPFGRRIVCYCLYDNDLPYLSEWAEDKGRFLPYCVFWSLLVGIIISYSLNRFGGAALGRRVVITTCLSAFLSGVAISPTIGLTFGSIFH